MLLTGTKNTTTQEVLTDGVINLGFNYRRNCRRVCGVRTFENNGNSITLGQQGMYHITAVLVGSGSEAGDVIVQLLENGEAVDGAFSTQTITTPETEFRTFVIDYFVLVDCSCVLGNSSIITKTIALQNTGVDAIFTTVVLNVEKEN